MIGLSLSNDLSANFFSEQKGWRTQQQDVEMILYNVKNMIGAMLTDDVSSLFFNSESSLL